MPRIAEKLRLDENQVVLDIVTVDPVDLTAADVAV